MDIPSTHGKLNECFRLIHQAYFQNALNKVPESERACLRVVKLLNEISKQDHTTGGSVANSLSLIALQLYDAIAKSPGQSFLSNSDKLSWIASYVKPNYYFPLVDESFHQHYIPQYANDDLELPAQYDAQYKAIESDYWGIDALDTLYQDLLSNCSFVSAMLAVVQANQSSLLRDLIFPRRASACYQVSYHFNGCRRLVSIDNRIPVLRNNTDRNLFMKSSENHRLLWPALIEKAFLKIMGTGYNFDGSNMAVDTYMLTGWAPEIIRIKHGRLPSNFSTLWNLVAAGRVTLGLGTGKLDQAMKNQLNLIPFHDYVVHSYDDVSKAIVLKNPWLEQNNEARRFITLESFDLNSLNYLYINWNSSQLFKYTITRHFVMPKLASDTIHWYSKPQFSLANPFDREEEVWLVLEKHLQRKKDESLMKVSVFKTDKGEKVMVPHQYLMVKENDDTCRVVSVKVKLQPLCSYTVVITGMSLVSFSLSLHHNFSADFKLAKSPLKYSSALPPMHGEWTMANDGGNWSLSSFINNPQFELEVREETTNIFMVLFSGNPERQVNFHLFYADHKGVAIRNFDKSKLLFNENYTPEFHFHEIKQLKHGFYKLIVSSYESLLSAEGSFSLLTYHDCPSPGGVKLTRLSTSLGLFTKSTQFDWNQSNRKKIFFDTDHFNCAVSFHLKYSSSSNRTESVTDYRPAIRGSVFNARTEYPVQINEQWNDSVYGVFVDCKTDEPGTYILLVERFESGVGTCIIDAGSDKQFNIRQ